MSLYKYNGDLLLPERRGIIGVVVNSFGRTEHGSRVVRRGKKFGRISNYETDISTAHIVRIGRNGKNFSAPILEIEQETSGSNIVRTNSSKKRRQLALSKSVDYIIEPRYIRNFINFALEYVVTEDKLQGSDDANPRFGGHQTVEEREKSFIARDQTLHCGFVKKLSGSSILGFDLAEKDKAYLSTCKVAVSSCIFGSLDFLQRPTSKKMDIYRMKEDILVYGEWSLSETYHIKTCEEPERSQNSYHITCSPLHDPLQIIEYFLWRSRSEYAIAKHYDRHCVREEVLQNKHLKKYDPRAIDKQFNFYQSNGLTKFDPSDRCTLLSSYVPEGSFIVRAHTPMSNLFSCLWFNEVDRFTSWDQLSFGYTYLKLRRENPDQPFYLKMFKVLKDKFKISA